MSQLRFLIAIPCFNNETTINQVIANSLELTTLPILIIDDGSDKLVAELIHKNFPSNPRLNFLRFEKYEGKGAAIQAAFSYGVERNYTHVITMSAEGVHHAFEIPLLTAAATITPFGIIVGSREAVSLAEPDSNKLSKRIAKFWNKLWAKYQTDAKVVDILSGFRCYPLFYMQNMNFRYKRLDFDIEVLIRLIWNGVDIKNIKTSVVYDPNDSSKNKTKNLKENLKMMTLRATLVVVSLVTEPSSPIQSALAVAIGVFVGVVPVYGLHLAIVATISAIFRVNFIYLWLGTHISIPPFIPLLLAGANLIGKKFFDYFYHQQNGFALTMAVGSVILGIILAFVAFIFVFLIKRKISLREKNFAKHDPFRPKNSGALIFLEKNTNAEFFKSMIPVLAACTYLFSFKTRKASKQYWKLIQPKIRFFKIQKNIYRQIRIDLQCQRSEILQKKAPLQNLNSFTEGSINFVEKQHIVISGHVGNFRQIQRMTNSQSIPLLIDRCNLKRFELVLFLKKIAPFDTTAFRLAVAYNLSIEFLFIIYQDGSKFKTCSFRPVMNEKLSPSESLSDLLSQYVMILENLLKIYPDQWFNFYPFWSTQPHQATNAFYEPQTSELVAVNPA